MLYSKIFLSKADICLGKDVMKPDPLINHLILLAKLNLFKCRLAYVQASFMHYLQTVKQAEEIDSQIAINNKSFHQQKK
mgnify:CR=1 FL=1